MTPLNKYSICFLPDPATLQIVEHMKYSLGESIGWFNSKNSIGHITITEFSANEQQTLLVKKHIENSCAYFEPISTTICQFNHFTNGAFYLDFDSNSSLIFKEYAKQINKGIHIKNSYKSTTPHLSIARKLTAAKIEQAYELFGRPDFLLQCNQIALRRLNPLKLQFDILETFTFQAKIKPQQQLTLF